MKMKISILIAVSLSLTGCFTRSVSNVGNTWRGTGAPVVSNWGGRDSLREEGFYNEVYFTRRDLERAQRMIQSDQLYGINDMAERPNDVSEPIHWTKRGSEIDKPQQKPLSIPISSGCDDTCLGNHSK